jgi:hypothetical protein
MSYWSDLKEGDDMFGPPLPEGYDGVYTAEGMGTMRTCMVCHMEYDRDSSDAVCTDEYCSDYCEDLGEGF